MAPSLFGNNPGLWLAAALITVALGCVGTLWRRAFALFIRSCSVLGQQHTSSLDSDSRTMANPQPEFSPVIEGQSLLDSFAELIDFPTLQPESAISKNGISTEKSTGALPIIRTGSPIELSEPPPVQSAPLISAAVQSVKTQDSPRDVSSHDGELRWAIPSNIFISHQDKIDAIIRRGNFFDLTTASKQPFIRYGLRYVPGDEEEDEYIYRSVVIEGLPATVQLQQVLAGIRGGAVYSASLVDTTNLTGSPSALVTFITVNGAAAFYQRSRDGFYVGLHRTRLRLIHTPTYPLSHKVELQTNSGHTRCLIVRSRNPHLVKNILNVLSRLALGLHVEYFGKIIGDRDELHIRFFSIKMAIAAREILTERVQFYDFRIDFAPDPCAAP